MGSNHVVHLSSLNNASVKQAVSLRNSRQRQKSQATLIDGKREIAYAIAGGVKMESIFCDESVHHEIDGLLSELDYANETQVYICTTEVMDKLAFGGRASTFVAIAKMPDIGLSNPQWAASLEKEHALVLVLDQIEKPGNIGAVVRTATAIGASVMLSDPICNPFSPNSIRASQGAIFAVPIAAAPAEKALRHLVKTEFNSHLAIVDDGEDYTTVDLTGRTAVVFGNEANGLGENWRNAKQRNGMKLSAISIPTIGVIDSLNVSIAAAVLGFESTRQRKHGFTGKTK